MSAGFTPGPWRVFREAWRGKSQRFIAADVPARGKLAHVFSLYADPEVEVEANARLIAAAPALYEALADFVAMRDRYLTCPEVDEGEASQLLDEAHEKARTVLAQARGDLVDPYALGGGNG